MIAINGRDLSGSDKQRIVSMFLGDPITGNATITEISTQYAVHRSTVEDVLREAIRGLVQLAGDTIKDLADEMAQNAEGQA